jgi:hypothetical protein
VHRYSSLLQWSVSLSTDHCSIEEYLLVVSSSCNSSVPVALVSIFSFSFHPCSSFSYFSFFFWLSAFSAASCLFIEFVFIVLFFSIVFLFGDLTCFLVSTKYLIFCFLVFKILICHYFLRIFVLFSFLLQCLSPAGLPSLFRLQPQVYEASQYSFILVNSKSDWL